MTQIRIKTNYLADKNQAKVHVNIEVDTLASNKSNLIKKIETLKGIAYVLIVDKYTLRLFKGELFEWDDIIPQVKAILQDKPLIDPAHVHAAFSQTCNGVWVDEDNKEGSNIKLCACDCIPRGVVILSGEPVVPSTKDTTAPQQDLESKVCKYDLSVKLKNAGVNQESEYYWCTSIPNCDTILLSKKEVDRQNKLEVGFPVRRKSKYASAFTLEELNNMLPTTIVRSAKKYNLEIHGLSYGLYRLGYFSPESREHEVYLVSDEPFHLRVDLLLHVIDTLGHTGFTFLKEYYKKRSYNPLTIIFDTKEKVDDLREALALSMYDSSILRKFDKILKKHQQEQKNQE